MEKVERPKPGRGQLLVRVAAAGVGLWDCWIRAGRSVISQPLPLTPGADFAGTIEAVGVGVEDFPVGCEVYGVTNARFVGSYAEHALAEAGMIALRPPTLSAVEAASVPVIGCTALQMLFDDAAVAAGHTVVVLGGGGNVGGYAVQLATLAGAKVIATGRRHHLTRIAELGASAVSADEPVPARFAGIADTVIDTVGGAALAGAFDWLRPGGVLVSAVAQPDLAAAAARSVEARFALVQVTTSKLRQLARYFATGTLRTHVGLVLPLEEARVAHALIEGAQAPPGKLVLVPLGGRP